MRVQENCKASAVLFTLGEKSAFLMRSMRSTDKRPNAQPGNNPLGVVALAGMVN
jgi:hypothetical protein